MNDEWRRIPFEGRLTAWEVNVYGVVRHISSHRQAPVVQGTAMVRFPVWVKANDQWEERYFSAGRLVKELFNVKRRKEEEDTKGPDSPEGE